jgi:SAM-dependent methyltransferase
VRPAHLEHLCCAECGGNLLLAADQTDDAGRVVAGRLTCEGCASVFPIVSYIPRFVPIENYASGFGLEWTIHDRTQYDRESGTRLSEARFYDETRWPRHLDGELIIEAGSGSGRFTEHAAETGATVLSFDYSYAVDANYRSNGNRSNVLIVQADLFNMPFRAGYADKLFCFGVLQHTPDPRAAFLSLPRHVKPGGRLVADVYLKTFAKHALRTKYWVRPITRRLPPERLYVWTRRYVALMWPVARLLRRIPKVGPALNWRLLIGDYSRHHDDDAVLRTWAELDTFDMLAPRYDSPQPVSAVHDWGREALLDEVEIEREDNVVVIRGRTVAGGLDPAAGTR